MMKRNFLLLAIVATLASCGSDSGPSNGTGGTEPVTPGPNALVNRTEISVTEAINIMKANAQFNQAINIGDTYTETETQYKDFQENTDCLVKTVSTYTVLEYNKGKDELTNLNEETITRSGEKCTDSGTKNERYLTIEQNISKKFDFETGNFDSLRAFRGTVNGKLFLGLTGKTSYETQVIEYEILSNPVRPLWTESDYSKIILNGSVYTISTSGGVTNVDTSGIDTTGLNTVIVSN